MPSGDYYAGLSPPQALRKLANHHASPRTRHLSLYELGLLHRFADDLETPDVSRTRISEEANEQWLTLLQTYWTGFSARDDEQTIEIISIPARVAEAVPFIQQVTSATEADKFHDEASGKRAVPATVSAVHALIASLMIGALTEAAFEEETFLRLLAKPSEIRRLLTAADEELLNRALYQPSVPSEASQPSFKSLEDLVSGAGGGLVGLSELPDIGYLGIVKAGSAIILIKVSVALGDRLAELIRDVRR